MDCPVCKNVNLVMADRQGIEIDYCPNCRGVWLDRGELDKLIDRAAIVTSSPRGEPHSPTHYPGHYDHHHGYPSHHGGHYKKKKREGFLGELFDFD